MSKIIPLPQSSLYPSKRPISTSSTTSSETFSIKKDGGTRFTRLLEHGFEKFGYFAADNPKWLLILTLVFAILTSVKVPLTKQQNDLKNSHTPFGARSRDEYAMFKSFFTKDGSEPIHMIVFISSKNNQSLAQIPHLNATMNVIDDIATNFTLKGLNFYQMCTDFCEFNEPIRQFKNGLILTKNQQISSENSLVNLTFPFMSIFGAELDLSPVFFGVEKFENHDAQLAANSSANIKHLPLIVAQFKADKPKNVTKDDIKDWERSLANYYHKKFKSDLIKPQFLTVTFASDEIRRNGMTLFPFISVGFVTLLTFAILTVGLSAWYFGQWTNHKITLVFVGCVCPLLATSSALGFLFLCGFRFGSILAVTPFLILAIGVDDAFLMINSWQRICLEKRKQKENYDLIYADNLRDRISEMFVDVGPSITITFSTNVLAFFIDMFAPTPEITLFCIANAVAIFFDYIFQFTLFGPILILIAKKEMNMEDEKKFVIQETKFKKNLQNYLKNLMKNYCDWLSNNFTFIFTLIVLIVYWIVSIHGTLNIKPSITPEKIVLSDSPIIEMDHLRNEYILPNYTPVNIFVNNVGNLSNLTRQQRIKNMINDFEIMPESLGAQFSHFWLRDYEKFKNNDFEMIEKNLTDDGNDYEFTKESMKSFLTWPEYKHWNGFLRFDDNGILEKFYFIVAYHGKEMKSWNHRANLLNQWRNITDQYPDLDAMIYIEDGQFLDQIAPMIPSTIQTSTVTIICMAIICTIFMGNLFTTIVATLSILSICIGVFGFLSLWGIDLDPISMATIIMSIGFSVDFPAHSSFHYYRTGLKDNLKPNERIYEVLTSIMYPLCQCGFSTILFVLCLLFVTSYMSEVFVKTMVLVIFFGLIHGIFIIPVTLCAFSRIYEWFNDFKVPILEKFKSTTKPKPKALPKIETVA